MNELLLIVSLVLIYSTVLLAYRYLGKEGLYCYTVFATITANLEVMLVVDAFGMEQTLGNILFAATFLVTDILSENEGKKEANKAVNIGIITSIFFIVLSQLWLLYVPSSSDWASSSFDVIFSNTPRIMLASVAVYAICQRFDVWLYHKWWALTDKKFGNHDKFLWLRNNGSTLISQLLNTILYNVAAFGGMYDFETMVSICAAGYVIFIVTSLADTPAAYAARKIKRKYFTAE
jgi:uncharacterized integral membrane protein (TIGR00697 family)